MTPEGLAALRRQLELELPGVRWRVRARPSGWVASSDDGLDVLCLAGRVRVFDDGVEVLRAGDLHLVESGIIAGAIAQQRAEHCELEARHTRQRIEARVRVDTMGALCELAGGRFVPSPAFGRDVVDVAGEAEQVLFGFAGELGARFEPHRDEADPYLIAYLPRFER